DEIQQSKLSDDVIQQAEDKDFKALSMTPLRFDNIDSVQLVYTDAVDYMLTSGSIQQNGNEIIVDSTMSENYDFGDVVKVKDSDTEYKITGFAKRQMYAHTPIAFTTKNGFEEIKPADVNIMVGSENLSNLDEAKTITKKELMNGIPSYQAEQLPLKLMVVF